MAEGLRKLHPELEARHTTSYLGMVIFLASWAVLFAALFFTFAMYRVRASSWPPPGFAEIPLWLPALNTGILVASSLAYERGRRLLLRGQAARFFPFLLQSVLLAVAFLALQIWLWLSAWEAGVRTDTSGFTGHFYLLTVFHGLHVLVGAGLLLWLLPQSRHAPTPRLATRSTMVALFWHFVGVVWILIFLLLFAL